MSTSAILHSYCNKRTWLTGALMILFKQESAALQWI
jgi:hypothetical protein